MKFIHENIYSHGISKISNLLSRPRPTSAMIRTIFFYNINVFLLLDEFPQKIIPYFIIE
jgi:hypothetical protein